MLSEINHIQKDKYHHFICSGGGWGGEDAQDVKVGRGL